MEGEGEGGSGGGSGSTGNTVSVVHTRGRERGRAEVTPVVCRPVRSRDDTEWMVPFPRHDGVYLVGVPRQRKTAISLLQRFDGCVRVDTQDLCGLLQLHFICGRRPRRCVVVVKASRAVNVAVRSGCCCYCRLLTPSHRGPSRTSPVARSSAFPQTTSDRESLWFVCCYACFFVSCCHCCCCMV